MKTELSGLVLIDKPVGPTSGTVSLWVRAVLDAKTAHCGTLDPNVSGVLPVLVGKGIKLQEFLQQHDKEYICLMSLEKAVPEATIRGALSEFEGKIFQRPPEMASVAKNVRIRSIYHIELLEIEGRHVLFSVLCEHGTYIRKLVEDLGHVLGQKPEMKELRRVRVNGFVESECHTLTQLKDAAELYNAGDGEPLSKILLPLEEAVRSLPKVYVKEPAVGALCSGADLMAPGFASAEGHIDVKSTVALMTEKKELIGIGIALMAKPEMEKAKRGPIVDLKKVVMEKGIYPWKKKTF